MPITKDLESAITKTKRDGRDFEAIFTDGVFMGFEIKSFENGSSYTISSPRKKDTNGDLEKPALTFTINNGDKAISEEDIIVALIDQVTTANAERIFKTTSRQFNTVNKQPLAYIKELGVENLSKQLLATPNILNAISQYADKIIEDTVNKVNNQRHEKLANLIRKHKSEKNFDKANFTKNFNEYLTIATNQYIDAYLYKAKPNYLENIEVSPSFREQYKKENEYHPENRSFGDDK